MQDLARFSVSAVAMVALWEGNYESTGSNHLSEKPV